MSKRSFFKLAISLVGLASLGLVAGLLTNLTAIPAAHAERGKAALAIFRQTLAGTEGRALVEDLLGERDSTKLLAKILGDEKSELGDRSIESVRRKLLEKLSNPSDKIIKRAMELLEVKKNEPSNALRAVFPCEVIARMVEQFMADPNFRTDLIHYNELHVFEVADSDELESLLFGIVKKLGLVSSEIPSLPDKKAEKRYLEERRLHFEHTVALVRSVLENNELGDIGSGRLTPRLPDRLDLLPLLQSRAHGDAKFKAALLRFRDADLTVSAESPAELRKKLLAERDRFLAVLDINPYRGWIRGLDQAGERYLSSLPEEAEQIDIQLGRIIRKLALDNDF